MGLHVCSCRTCCQCCCCLLCCCRYCCCLFFVRFCPGDSKWFLNLLPETRLLFRAPCAISIFRQRFLPFAIAIAISLGRSALSLLWGTQREQRCGRLHRIIGFISFQEFCTFFWLRTHKFSWKWKIENGQWARTEMNWKRERKKESETCLALPIKSQLCWGSMRSRRKGPNVDVIIMNWTLTLAALNLFYAQII